MPTNKILYNCFLGLCLISFVCPTTVSGGECGSIIKPLSYYDNISLYSLILCCGLFLAGTLIDRKLVKTIAFSVSLLPLTAWGYVHFMIDFTQIKKEVYAYNALAEQTLANIAEAQDRYKSEQGVFLKDLQKLYSHIAGSQGVDPCVRILKVNAGFSQWIAEAQHVSSPDVIRWDSSLGSSLKKG